MKCKKCDKEFFELDVSHFEFIYKTGYCKWCLIDMGYCD